MDLHDPRWSELRGGYRIPYDPRGALRSLEQGTDVEAAWNELWNELHHQGDVGEASYAALPHLVRIQGMRRVPDWNTYALAATIELERDRGRNPQIPPWLAESYKTAWRRLLNLALQDLEKAKDDTLVRSIIAVIALAKRQVAIAEFALLTEDERREMLARTG
jgi:hypothetical protein